MNSMIFSGLFLATFAICALSALILAAYSKHKELVSPWTLFLALAIFDIFVPSLFYLSNDFPECFTYWAPYIPYFENSDYTASLWVFSISIIFFAIGFFSIAKKRGGSPALAASRPGTAQSGLHLHVARVYGVMLLSGALYAVSIFTAIKKSGAFSIYLSEKFMRLYGQKVAYDSGLESLIMLSASMTLTLILMMVGILFYYRVACNRRFLWGIVFPLIGLLFAATTFMRGAQLNYLIMLLILETFRLKEQAFTRQHAPEPAPRQTKTVILKRTVGLSLLAVFLFSGYGAIRNFYSSQEQKADMTTGESMAFEAQRLLHGEGLVGLTWIMKFYPAYCEYLGGKTFVDMLLLPVPRSLYPTKPEWYGVADITRSMGGPQSSQDAVTMPGELYANFGYLGIPLMAVFGLIFGLCHRYRLNPRFRFVYATFLPSVMFTTFWMAFTGFVNQLVPIPLIVIVLWFVFSRSKRYHQQHPITNTKPSAPHAADS